MTPKKVLTVGPNGHAHVYSSLRAASRALSGLGSDARRGTITRRCKVGGGKVGEVYVQYTNLTHVTRG